MFDDLGSKAVELSGSTEIRRNDVRSRLLAEKKSIERRLKEIDEAINLLDRNPDVERLMQIVR